MEESTRRLIVSSIPKSILSLPPTQSPVRHQFNLQSVALFDRLNTQFEDQLPARDQIVKFLGNLHANDRIALYVLESNEVRVLHDFSHDAASLIATIKRHRASTSIEQAVTDTQ
jgi:hypothetical protein